MTVDKQFSDLLNDILENGSEVTTRNSVTKRKRNLSATFEQTPLISVRRTAWKSALREFEWFLSGTCDINDLHESVRHWWEPWANDDGLILNNYSVQFRNFVGRFDSGVRSAGHNNGVDQIAYLQESIKDHPFSRRAVISTWNTADMVHPDTPITNCHGTVIQAFVEPEDNSLHLSMYQRSADMVLGVPHNFIQYWAFLMYLAHHGGRKVGSFHWMGGDCHIYENHIEMAERIVENEEEIEQIELIYNPSSTEFLAEDFTLSKKYEPIIRESLEMTI